MLNTLLHDSVPSSGASIEVTSFNTCLASDTLGILLIACGGSLALLDKVPYPVAKMQLRGYRNNDCERGTGESAPMLHDYLQDIDNVIRHTGMVRPVILGYSSSGYFAAHYAIANPEKLRGLVLVEPAFLDTAEGTQTRVEPAEDGGRLESLRVTPKDLEPLIDEERRQNSAQSKEIPKSLADIDQANMMNNQLRIRKAKPVSEALLSKLAMPVLAVGGLQSHAARTITRLQRLLPTSYVWWLKGASHTELFSEKFGRQMETVLSTFLAGLPKS